MPSCASDSSWLALQCAAQGLQLQSPCLVVHLDRPLLRLHQAVLAIDGFEAGQLLLDLIHAIVTYNGLCDTLHHNVRTVHVPRLTSWRSSIFLSQLMLRGELRSSDQMWWPWGLDETGLALLHETERWRCSSELWQWACGEPDCAAISHAMHSTLDMPQALYMYTTEESSKFTQLRLRECRIR